MTQAGAGKNQTLAAFVICEQFTRWAEFGRNGGSKGSHLAGAIDGAYDARYPIDRPCRESTGG